MKFLWFNLAETTYGSTVLPPLFLVLVLSYLEKFLNKHLNETIRPLFVPFLCILIMVPLTLLMIGPVSDLLATGIANGYNFLVNLSPAIAGAVIGGVWQIVVIFGVHWGITPVVLANFELYGHDSFQAFQTCAVIAQVGAALGVMLKTRNKEFKNMTLSAFLTGIFGITEPIIYGVTLRLKKPFICGCITGAIGAVVTTFFGSLQYVYAGIPGLLTIVNAYSASNPSSLIGEIIGCAVAFFGAAAIVYFMMMCLTNC
ncbi:MAG: PTS transporter subunit EIIC [Eubacteriaceae bacterium]